MTTSRLSPDGYLYWEDVQPRLDAGETVHASVAPHSPTLCGINDSGPIALDLTHPDSRPLRASVTCPACLEWMHA